MKTTTQPPIDRLLTHRWMLRRDLRAVMAVERASYSEPWTEDELRRALATKNTIAHVFEMRDRIVAYCLYELHQQHLYLVKLAVAPGWRRRGIGRWILEWQKGKLTVEGRVRLLADVADHNLAGQLFYRACGFRCTGIQRGQFEWSDGQPVDGYRFAYLLPDAIPALLREEETPCR